MFGSSKSNCFHSRIRSVEAPMECLTFLAGRLFHPDVICAEPGGTCTRIEDTIRFLSRNLAHEERLMREINFPGFAAHKKEHELLIRNLSTMKRTLVCSRYDNAVLLNFLTDWGRRHSTRFDKPLSDFLRNNGLETKQA